jgi:signal peptide peptidase SppA
MPVQLNPVGKGHAKDLIKGGHVDRTSSWSMSAEDEDAILGNNNWSEYARWFLGLDDAENTQTKAHYKYPFGKGGKVYRSALIAIRQRASQQDASGVYDAAGELIELIDDNKEGSGSKEGAFDLWHAETARQPWAMVKGYVPRRVLAGGRRLEAGARPVNVRPPAASSGGTIAVIPVTGVISQHSDWYSDTSVDELTLDFMMALNDPSVSAILLAIDSPGGSVYGVQEVAQLILSAREQKPVIALANSLAASAAYWIGCSAAEFYCTPSGEVGSIGVWQAHMDMSGLLQNVGVNVTLISAGEYKVEGNPYQPLDDDAQGFMQSRVNEYYGSFLAGVAAGRGVQPDDVQKGMGQGRVLGALAAKKANMIDGIATMPQIIQKMQSKSASSSTRKSHALTHAQRRLQLLG